MPSGLMPTYSYVPAVGGDPHIKQHNSRRARLWAGGTYFRARDVGAPGNNISIEVFEWTPDGGELTGKCVVTNHNTKFEENVTGPVSVLSLDQQLTWHDEYIIDYVDGNWRVTNYSISGKIAPEIVSVQPFTWTKLFYVPSKLGLQLTPDTAVINPTDTVSIQARTRTYDLVAKTVTPTTSDGQPDPGGTPQTGWDIDDLRTKINADNPWIEMMGRRAYSAPGSTGVGATDVTQIPNADVQDDGSDAEFLTPFGDTYLTGGDGLPSTPVQERTGPIRSLVFVNYGEAYDGSLINVNTVYEWVGSNSVQGDWKPY